MLGRQTHSPSRGSAAAAAEEPGESRLDLEAEAEAEVVEGCPRYEAVVEAAEH